MPILHLVAGPNGAGKTTFVQTVLQPATHLPFVNADMIATARWPGAEVENAYLAAQVAAEQRNSLLAARQSFIAETVFSHESKVELAGLANQLGYLVELHVILIPETIAVPRVQSRVANGGHQVPAEKVTARYQRLFPLVLKAQRLVDRTTYYDNSRASKPFRIVARAEYGLWIGKPNWPAWTPEALTGALRNTAEQRG